MTDENQSEQPLGIRGMLGVGTDAEDGHTRISRGPRFLLVGGSRDTHEKMQHVAVKFNERVDERGKPLEKINSRELREIVEQVRDDVG